MQAETEVTAEKKSAKPLAQVTFNLLDAIDGFADVFFSKLVQRIGGWPIPIVVPPRDTDLKPWENDVAWKKAMGYRYKSGDRDQDEVESSADYATRIYGIMRVYFQILKITPQRQPLKPMFQLPRYWMWVARILGQRELLGTSIAAQLLYSESFAPSSLWPDAFWRSRSRSSRVPRKKFVGSTVGQTPGGHL